MSAFLGSGDWMALRFSAAACSEQAPARVLAPPNQRLRPGFARAVAGSNPELKTKEKEQKRCLCSFSLAPGTGFEPAT